MPKHKPNPNCVKCEGYGRYLVCRLCDRGISHSDCSVGYFKSCDCMYRSYLSEEDIERLADSVDTSELND